MLIAAALVVAGGLIWTWLFRDVQRQDKHVATVFTLFAGYSLFLLWVLIGSGWRATHRWTVILGTIAIGSSCALLLRISGVTGDLIPIVRWRWSGPPPQSAHSSQGTAVIPAAFTNHFPQFLGPNRDGVLPGPILARDWKRTPPRELWRRTVGPAWSGFAIEGRRAITQEQRGEDEVVACYDLLTGAPMWTHSDKSRYATTLAGEGPRATVTITSNRVFAMGARGKLSCLDLENGKLLWAHDTLQELSASTPEWGVACSPLLVGRAVVVTVGGSGHAIVGYDWDSGAQLWAAGSDSPHWCSPTRMLIDGMPQIVVFSESVSGYDAQDGRVLWQYPWRSPYPHVTTPAMVGTNRVLVSQGYGGGSELIEIAREKGRWKAKRVWKSNRLKSKFANLILRGAYVYGLDDGALVCLDLANGELKWKGDRYGHGQMLLVGDLLLIAAENGDVVLVEPSPSAPRELSRFKVFSSKTWNSPAIAGDILVVRNDREAAAFQLRTAD